MPLFGQNAVIAKALLRAQLSKLALALSLKAMERTLERLHDACGNRSANAV